jgi:hypothetical protein
VVCIVAPGTGRHRIHQRLDELEAELVRERAEKQLLLERIQAVCSAENGEPQLAAPVPTTTVDPSPSAEVEEETETDDPEAPETHTETTQSIDMRPVLKAITVRPLSDLTVIGRIPPQRNRLP